MDGRVCDSMCLAVPSYNEKWSYINSNNTELMLYL